MSSASFDLDAYLVRIGYAGAPVTDLETLSAIHERHAQTIPFENLDILLGRGIPLDLPALERKLVREKRGGYCFEQNTLFAAALRALGFSVTPMLARVRWLVPAGVVLPQTHMVLRVGLAGRAWLADVGFGGVGLMAPIALDSSEVQHSRYEPRRLVPQGHNILQQVLLGDTWTDVYLFNPDEAFAIDFEAANWFTSTHPQSRFKQNLTVARADGTRRLTVLNREFTVRDRGGSAEKRLLNSPEELLAVLAENFGLVLPAETRFTCPALPWE